MTGNGDDLAEQEREFEALIQAGRITPSGLPTSMAGGLTNLPRRSCPTIRTNGTPCPWPTVDGTAYCTVHVGREHHEWKSRAATVSLSTWWWLRGVLDGNLQAFGQLVAAYVVLQHLGKRGVRVDWTAGSPCSVEVAPRHRLTYEHVRSGLGEMIETELLAGQPARPGYLTPMLERALFGLLRDFDRPRSPLEEQFRLKVEGVLDDEEWSLIALKHLAARIAEEHLAAIYGLALHGTLGWKPDSGASERSIQRAQVSVELLQRITNARRRGRRKDDPQEVRREIQHAIDIVLARGERLSRYAVAAEIGISVSGLDYRLDRLQLRINWDGLGEFSAIN